MEKKTMMILAVVVVVIVLGGVMAWYFTKPDDGKGNNTIYYTAISPALQKQAISNGTVSGGVSWEPYVSDSLVDGSAHALVWSGEFWPNHPCCVVAARTGFAESNPELVSRMIKVHLVASDWVTTTLSEGPGTENYTKLMAAGATFSNRGVNVVENATEHILYETDITPAVEDYLVLFTEKFVELGIVTNATIEQRGYDNATDFVSNIVDTTYFDAAVDIQPSEIIVGTVRLGYLTGDLHQFARVVAMDDDIWGGKSLYETYGIDVQVDNPAGFANGPLVMDAFAANAIDVGYLGAPPAMQKALNVGTDIKIVALANEEGSAIIANNEIDSFGDLVNRTVATPGPGSIQHLFLLAYAEDNGYRVVLKAA
jgi:NitT/TauT family transport system substrate-binding protein